MKLYIKKCVNFRQNSANIYLVLIVEALIKGLQAYSAFRGKYVPRNNGLFSLQSINNIKARNRGDISSSQTWLKILNKNNDSRNIKQRCVFDIRTSSSSNILCNSFKLYKFVKDFIFLHELQVSNDDTISKNYAIHKRIH